MKETRTKTRENLPMKKEDRLLEGAKLWVSYYRANIEKFIDDFFDGINLYPFQKIIISEMDSNNYSILITSRGLSKSYTLATYLCARCILYPGTKVVLSCETKEMSRRIITEKIQGELMNSSSNLKREIEKCSTGKDESYVLFKNGSKITSLNASESTRGMRAHILVIDEYVTLKNGLSVISNILQPFLQVPRRCPYHANPKYANLYEENKEIYASSAKYKNTWYYDLYVEARENMIDGKPFFVCNLPYTLANKHGLMSNSRVQQIKEDKNMTRSSFAMEYCAIWWGLTENAFFTVDDLMDNRNIIKPWYQPTLQEYKEQKDKRSKSWEIPKETKKELRVLSCDIALSASSESKRNDASIYTFIRSIPKGDSYISDVLYTESVEGMSANDQALKIKRLFYDADIDYIVIDSLGVGLSVVDALGERTYDEERDIEYPPMSIFNLKDKQERCKYKNAVPCIYGIVATEQLNSDIAQTFKTALQNHTIQFLIDEREAEDYLIDHKNYATITDENIKIDLIMPYLQTTLMVNEILELEVSITNRGNIKLSERGSSRKDRYSSVSYGIYFIKQEEKKLTKRKKGRLKPLWN